MWQTIIIVIVSCIIIIPKEIFCGPSGNIKISQVQINSFKDIGRRIKEKINFNVDPCIDYYHYICDNFNKSDTIFQRSVNLEKLLENDKELVQSGMDAEVKMKNFLNSCRMKNSEHVQELLRELTFPQSIRKWPVFNENWSKDPFDLISTIAELKTFGINTVIDVKFERRNYDNMILIKPNYEHVCDHEKLERIFYWLEIPVDNRMELINDCIHFQDESDKILLPVKTDGHISTTFKEFKNKVPDFDWNKYFRVLTEKDIKDDFPVQIQDNGGLQNVIQKILKIETKIIANYLFCAFADKIYAHVMRQTSCYSETFMNFHPVVYRRIKDYSYSEEMKNYILEVVKALLDNLFNSMNIFEGETSESAFTKMKKILNDFIPNLTEDAVNKEFQNLEIYKNSYLKNIINLYQFKMKKFCGEFFTEDKSNVIERIFSPQVFIQSTYYSFNQPSPVAFTHFGMPFLSDSVLYYRLIHDYSDSVRECFKKQLQISKELDISDLHGIEGTEIYVKSYNSWIERNKERTQQENDIFDEYGFTSRKVFFALAMQNACGYGDKENPHKIILSTLGNLKEFSEEYNCPLGSPMNPEQKCNFKL